MSGGTTTSLQIYANNSTTEREVRAETLPMTWKNETERAEWLACQETWRPFPPRRRTSEHVAYTLPWFKQIEERRYARHGHWIPRRFEFNRHQGEQVLGLGDGLGTDWVRYALGGANVTFCSPEASAREVVQRHFEVRGLKGKFIRGVYENLPFADGSMDVVCLSSAVPAFGSINALSDEIYRVLKPGGKILAALPALYDARYWQDCIFPWNRWFEPRPAQTETRFTGKEVRRLFQRFTDQRLKKQHLRRSDLPHVWRWILLPILERVMGRYLIFKAFKPVVSAGSTRVAA